jgi:hypothetical protein
MSCSLQIKTKKTNKQIECFSITKLHRKKTRRYQKDMIMSATPLVTPSHYGLLLVEGGSGGPSPPVPKQFGPIVN